VGFLPAVYGASTGTFGKAVCYKLCRECGVTVTLW